MSRLADLLKDAGAPISRVNRRLRDTPVTLSKNLLLDLDAVLHLRNGFRAVEGAIVVRPSVTVGQMRSVEDWNQLTLWRSPYRGSSDILFFAETVFGDQFGLFRDEIVLFDPETGERTTWAFSLEAWAEKVLAQADALGRRAVRAWNEDHKPLEITDRLQRRRPRRFGGEGSEVTMVRDLELMKRIASMYRANLETIADADAKLDGWWAGPESEPTPAPPADAPQASPPPDATDEERALLAEIARELAAEDPEHEAAKAAAAAPRPTLDDDLPPPEGEPD